MSMESQFLSEYHEQIAGIPRVEDGYYHIDIPVSIDTQRAMILEEVSRILNLFGRGIAPLSGTPLFSPSPHE